MMRNASMEFAPSYVRITEASDDGYDLRAPSYQTVTIGMEEMEKIAEHWERVRPKTRQELRINLARLLDPAVDAQAKRIEAALHQDYV